MSLMLCSCGDDPVETPDVNENTEDSLEAHRKEWGYLGDQDKNVTFYYLPCFQSVFGDIGNEVTEINIVREYDCEAVKKHMNEEGAKYIIGAYICWLSYHTKVNGDVKAYLYLWANNRILFSFDYYAVIMERFFANHPRLTRINGLENICISLFSRMFENTQLDSIDFTYLPDNNFLFLEEVFYSCQNLTDVKLFPGKCMVYKCQGLFQNCCSLRYVNLSLMQGDKLDDMSNIFKDSGIRLVVLDKDFDVPATCNLKDMFDVKNRVAVVGGAPSFREKVMDQSRGTKWNATTMHFYDSIEEAAKSLGEVDAIQEWWLRQNEGYEPNAQP